MSQSNQQPEWMLTAEEMTNILLTTDPLTPQQGDTAIALAAQRKLVKWLAGRRDTGCYWYEDEADCEVEIFALDENDWQQLCKDVGLE